MRLAFLLIFLFQLSILQGQRYSMPFQQDWLSFPFQLASGRIKAIDFKVERLGNARSSKGAVPQVSEYRRAFDIHGREITTLSAQVLKEAYKGEIILTGYDSLGCPEYNNFERDAAGWVHLSQVGRRGDHCREGRVDTVMAGHSFAYGFDSLGRVVRVEELMRRGEARVTHYAYDGEGRLASIDGAMLQVQVAYRPDSILVTATDSFNERLLFIYQIGGDGLPVSSTVSELAKNGRLHHPIEKTTYTYRFR